MGSNVRMVIKIIIIGFLLNTYFTFISAQRIIQWKEQMIYIFVLFGLFSFFAFENYLGVTGVKR